jgi:hypothetical protein
MGDGPPKQKLLRITFFLLRHHDAPHDADHEGYDQDDPDDHVNWSVSAVAPTIHQPLMCKAPHDQSSLCTRGFRKRRLARPDRLLDHIDDECGTSKPLPSHGIGPSHEIQCRGRKNRWISGAYFATVIAICARSSMIKGMGTRARSSTPDLFSSPPLREAHSGPLASESSPATVHAPQAQTAHATPCPQIWRTQLGT